MIDMKYINLALEKLTPNGAWSIAENQIEGSHSITWLSEEVEKPSWDLILSTAKDVLKNEIANNYKMLRAKEYPPIEEYIDGVVKQDQDQIDAYIEKCLQVKLKYPKSSAEVDSALLAI